MEIGNKGDGLVEILENNVSTPYFSILSKEFFIKFLKDTKAYEVAELLAMENAWVHTRFALIKKLILENPVSIQIENEITDSVKNLKFPIAVRSSASIEDGLRHSAAGFFSTLLNVQRDKLVQAVREVIASLYDEKCILLVNGQDLHPESFYMSVILQEMVVSEWSGIAFTSDPNTGDSSIIQVEMGLGLGDKIVSGTVEIERYFISKNDEVECSEPEKLLILNELKTILLKLEKVFKRPIDVEWSYSCNKIYILQCRPITTIQANANIDRIKLFSISGLNQITYQYLGFLQNRYTKLLKKAKLFNVCEKNNIKTHKWKLLCFNEHLLETFDFTSIFQDFESDYILWSINGHKYSFDFSYNILGKIKEFINIYKENHYCISLREILPNEYSAISSINEDGTMLIECVGARMYYLKSGVLSPSKYLLDSNGDIISSNIIEQDEYFYDDDFINMKQTGKRKLIQLSNNQINQIYKSTKILNNAIGRCAPEWWIFKGNIYAGDISILKTDGLVKNNVTITRGITSGYLFKLPSLTDQKIDELSCFNAITVNDVNFDLEKVELFKNLKNKLIEASRGKGIILYSDRPYIFLAPFKEMVSGFVFKNASSLCHLSLILREDSIPAISLEGDNMDNEKEGGLYELNANEGIINFIGD